MKAERFEEKERKPYRKPILDVRGRLQMCSNCAHGVEGTEVFPEGERFVIACYHVGEGERLRLPYLMPYQGRCGKWASK